jgi:hypothetical protein
MMVVMATMLADNSASVRICAPFRRIFCAISGAILLGHAAQLVIDPKSVKVYRQSKATIKVTIPVQRRQTVIRMLKPSAITVPSSAVTDQVPVPACG